MSGDANASPLPPPLDQGKWEDAAHEFAVQSLARVQGAAEKWTGTVSVLIGIFGSTAVFLSPQDLFKSLSGHIKVGAYVGLLVASLLAVAAVILGALAAQGGIPRVREDWNGDTFYAYLLENSGKAVSRLRQSRWCGVTAAVVVFAVGWVTAINGLTDTEKKSPIVAVVQDNGNLLCGKLGKDSVGRTTVGGKEVEGTVRQLTTVASCP